MRNYGEAFLNFYNSRMPGHGKENMMFFWKRNESPEAKLKKADEHYQSHYGHDNEKDIKSM